MNLRDDRGAVLVFYTILLLAIFAMVALVLDAGALRLDLRASRSKADFAVVAGAMDLDPFFGGTPKAACLSAWNYFLANTPEAAGTPDPCSAFDGQTDASCNPSLPIEVSQVAGPYTVTISWPVPDTSPLLEGRLNPQFDGGPCERIAVEIERTRGFVFSSAIGIFSAETTTHAVARTSAGENLAEIASLVILEPFACTSLYTSGQGKVWVWKAIDADGNIRPGIITNDSAGSQNCTPSDPYTIDAKGEVNSEIKAGVDQILSSSGPALVDPTAGLIFSYALLIGNSATSYDPSDISGTPPRLAPVPRAGGRVTRAVVDHQYNCKTGYPSYYGIPILDCPKAGTVVPHVDQLRSYVRLDGLSPGGPGDFQEYAGPCDSPPPSFLGDWWINCPGGFSIDSSVTFGPDPITGAPGRVVFEGTVNVGSQGSLSINSSTGGDTWVFFRDGEFRKDAQATIRLERTFVYLTAGPDREDGRIFLNAGAGITIWTAPTTGQFEDLALWTEKECQNPRPCKMGGQATLFLEGIFFLPNATPFVYDGQPSTVQQKAQFFTRRLEAGGQGALIMTPDPDRNVPTPIIQTYLIR